MVELKGNYILETIFILYSIFLIKASATELERSFPTSCKNVNKNSMQEIRPNIVQVKVSNTKESFYTKCNQEIENGSWTVVLHRYTGKQDFSCNWDDCVKGFGNINGEFFIGLERLHDITSYTLHELMFILEDFDNETRTAKYDAFAIEDETSAFRIYLLGDYSGNAGDSFKFHAGSKFSTKDKEHSENCVRERGAPGWYNSCYFTNIFGEYLFGTYEDDGKTICRGIYWKGFRRVDYALKRITMLIRPIN